MASGSVDCNIYVIFVVTCTSKSTQTDTSSLTWSSDLCVSVFHRAFRVNQSRRMELACAEAGVQIPHPLLTKKGIV